jgi:hypothetical protein
MNVSKSKEFETDRKEKNLQCRQSLLNSNPTLMKLGSLTLMYKHNHGVH